MVSMMISTITKINSNNSGINPNTADDSAFLSNVDIIEVESALIVG